MPILPTLIVTPYNYLILLESKVSNRLDKLVNRFRKSTEASDPAEAVPGAAEASASPQVHASDAPEPVAEAAEPAAEAPAEPIVGAVAPAAPTATAPAPIVVTAST